MQKVNTSWHHRSHSGRQSWHDVRLLNASLPVLITRTCGQTACLSPHCCHTCVLLSASISKVSQLPGFRKRFNYHLITDSASLQTLWSGRSQLKPQKMLRRNTQFTVWVLPERPVRYPTPFLSIKDRLQLEMNDLALTARMRTVVLTLTWRYCSSKCFFNVVKASNVNFRLIKHWQFDMPLTAL